MSKIIIANWKMQPTSSTEAKELFNAVAEQKYEGVTSVICPPFVYLEELAALQNQNIKLGAQDAHWQESGAFTGEISTKQLAEFGVEYVLVGHSERRALGETDEMVNQKLLAILAAGIKPVLLVGEKEKGDYRQDILIDQLTRDLTGVSPEAAKNLLVVYEPVWAISSHSGGISDTPESAAEAMRIVREILVKMFSKNGAGIPILYGGSVNSENVARFLNAGFAGAVVGSASLDPEKFNKILEITNKI